MPFFTLFSLRRRLPALLLLLPFLAQAQLKITQATTPTTEDFNGLGTATTTGTAAPLPVGFQLTAAAATPVYGASSNTTATTQSTTYKNSFTAGGSYNFGDGGTAAASATDRALGFLASGGTGAGLPRSILVAIQNTTGSAIQDLQVQFDLEQYRTNVNAYTWTFFSSADGSTWTSQSAGDQSFAAGTASAYSFPPVVTNKSLTLTNLNLASNGIVYLRWTMTGSNTNSQGIGLDNLVLTPTLGTGTPTPAPAASITTTASTYASPYCLTNSAGSAAFNVAFTSSNVTAGSTYAVQLSNASGTFSSDLTQNLIGSGTSSPLPATIPAGTASGSAYRIRVVSGSTAGTDNGSNLTVTLAPTSNPVTVTPAAAQTFATNASGTALTASASVASAYAWYYGTSAGGPYTTALAGATSATYQPRGSDFPGPGTYYLVAQATSTCGSVVGTSPPVTLTLTAPPAAFTLSTTSLPDFGSISVGSTSSVKSFTVSGTSLSGPLTITPPVGFEIRTGATAFACCVLTLTPDANGNLPATAIDVRFAPLAAQAYSDQVTLTTSGQPTQSVAVSGTGTAPIYPAAVASTAPTNVGKTSATAGGSVTDEGGSPVTARGLVYGFEADPGLSTGAVTAGSGLGSFTAQLTGLLPDSLYYVRAYATNALGTTYGEQFTFTTLPQPLDAEPSPASHITASSVRPTRVLLTLSGGQPGVKHLVLARLNGPTTVKPQDATAYTANSTFSQGQLLGTATYAVLSAAQDTVTIFGLHANTPYSFAVYDYQDLNATPYAQNYLTSAADSLTLTTPPLPATRLLREDFMYAGGAKLTDNGWTAHSAAGTNAVSVVSNANPYPYYSGYSDGLGNAVALKTSGEDVSRQFPTIYPRTAVYVSFVAVVSSATAAGDYVLHLGSTTLSSTFRGRVYVRQASSGNAIQFGVSGSGNTTPPTSIVYTPATYSLNTSYLLLLKYSFDETGNTTELYINPDPTGTGGAYRTAATADVSVTEGASTSPTDIGTIALRQGTATTSPTLTLDDLQVATSFPYTTPTPLPVQLAAFTAQLTAARTVRLNWQTASELNTDYFEVQRSADGGTFAPLSRQPAAGSSATTRAYQALDAAPLTGVPNAYYRLKVVDTDGAVSYSPIRTVALSATAADLALYPNPTRQLTTLTGAQPGVPVQVLDAVGRVVLLATADAAGAAPLALPAGLAAGVYVVRAGTQVTRLLLE